MKWIGISIGILVGLVVVAVGVGYGIARSSFGQKKIASFLVVQLQDIFQGKVSIEKVRTNLFRTVEVEGISIVDKESRYRLDIDRINLKYQLLPLLRRTFRIQEVRWGHAVWKGQKNGNPALQPEVFLKPSSGKPLPVDIDVSKIVGNLQIDQDLELSDFAKPALSSHIEIQLGLFVGRDDSLRVSDVLGNIAIQTPVEAHIELQGNVAKKKESLQFHKLRVRMYTDLTKQQLGPIKQKLRGPVDLVAQAEGSLEDLQAHVVLTTAAGQMKIQGDMQKEYVWAVDVDAQKWNVQALLPEIPISAATLWLHGEGEKDKGRVFVKQLYGEGLGAEFNARGNGRFSAQNLEEAEAIWTLEAPNLHTLQKEFDIASRGNVRGNGKVSYKDKKLTASATVVGKRVGVGSVGFQHMKVVAALVDKTAEIKANVTRLKAGGVELKTLALQGGGTWPALGLSVQGKGVSPGEMFSLRARSRGGSTEEISVVLEETRLARNGMNWRLQKPVTIDVVATKPVHVKMGLLTLVSDRQHIEIKGHYARDGRDIGLHAAAQGLDLQKIVHLFKPAVRLPNTNLSLQADVAGSVQNPVARVRIKGSSKEFEQLAWRKTQYAIDVDIRNQQAKGNLSVEGEPSELSGKKDQTKFAASFDVPLKPHKPLTAKISGDIPLRLVQTWLPASLGKIEGQGEITANFVGTLQKPQFELNLTLPTWALGGLHGKNATFFASYKQNRFAGNLSVPLQKDKEAMAMVSANWQATFPEAIADLVETFPASVEKAPFEVRFSLSKVNIPKWLAFLQVAKPQIQKGTLGLALEFSGPLQRPKLKLETTVDDIQTAELEDHSAQASSVFSYQGNRASANLQVRLDSKPLLRFDANAPVDVKKLLAEPTQAWKQIPLLGAKLEVLTYDLAGLGGAQGQIAGGVNMSGTLGQPKASAEFKAQNLKMEEWLVGTVLARASYAMGDKSIPAEIRLDKDKDHYIRVQADVPVSLQIDDAMARIEAKSYTVDYQPKRTADTGPLRAIAGTIDGKLDIGFREKKPYVDGSLSLQKATFVPMWDRRRYENVNVQISAHPKGNAIHVAIPNVSAQITGGTLKANASVDLEGTQLKNGKLTIKTEKFPVSQDALSVWVDTQIETEFATANNIIDTNIRVKNSNIRLPSLLSTKDLQPTDLPEELVYNDKKAREEAIRAKKKASAPMKLPEGLPHGVTVAIELEGPIDVSGPEVKASLEGEVLAKLIPPHAAQLGGYVRTKSGRLELFSRFYDVSKAQVTLNDTLPVDPALQVKLERAVGSVMLYVEVSGTAKNPKIRTYSIPALPDRQLLALLAGGDESVINDPSASPNMTAQATGAVSGFLAGQIANQLGIAKWAPDTLSVEAGDATAGTRVKAGKSFADNRFELTFATRIGGEAVSTRPSNNYEAGVGFAPLRDAKLGPRSEFLRNGFRIKAFYGDAGQGGVEFVLRFLRDYADAKAAALAASGSKPDTPHKGTTK